MTSSFLSYIAKQHGLTFEDVATDALAHVLRNSESARSALRKSLNAPDFEPLSERYSVETRTRTQDCGTPDLMLQDSEGIPCVIIEAKFTAGLTDHQPVSYLSYLRRFITNQRNAMLVFLVPESRKSHYEKKLRERCVNEDVQWGTTGVHGLSIQVMTWRECLAALRVSEQHSGFDIFLEDLERMCSVAEPDKFEDMTYTEAVEIIKPNSSLAARTRNFMDLASEVGKRAFTNSLKDSSKYNNAWGTTWCGVYGKIASEDAWIGVDSAAWSDHGVSPIWLEFEGQTRVPSLERRLKMVLEDDGYFIRIHANQIAIPLPLGTGTRDEVLENCRKKVEAVRKCLATD